MCVRVPGVPIVLFSRGEGFATAFRTRLDDRRLQFQREGDLFIDRETGSTWTLAGVAVRGPLEGKRLHPLPLKRAFWFSVSTGGEADLYTPGRPQPPGRG